MSRKIFDYRNANFLKVIQFVGERDCHLTLGYAFHEKFFYEFELKNVTKSTSKFNFIMPNYRLQNGGVEFDFFTLFYAGAPSQYKKHVESP